MRLVLVGCPASMRQANFLQALLRGPGSHSGFGTQQRLRVGAGIWIWGRARRISAVRGAGADANQPEPAVHAQKRAVLSARLRQLAGR
jgi:hypothetical protein